MDLQKFKEEVTQSMHFLREEIADIPRQSVKIPMFNHYKDPEKDINPEEKIAALNSNAQQYKKRS